MSSRAPSISPATNRNTSAMPYKRFTSEEMQCRRAQGLCFNCNEKFKVGHKCSKAQLLFLESEAAPRETVEDINEEIIRGVDQEETIDPKITFYALTGGAAPQTMRVMAKIESYEIIVLIDNGSTHNFINTRLANLLLLPIKLTAAFSVRVANREKLTCQGKFEKVQILIQDIPFSLTVYALPITRIYLVLGIQWLEKLGTVE